MPPSSTPFAQRALRSTQALRRSGPSSVPAQLWLARLVDAIPVARAGTDPEGVHRLRVALARLDVWLALGGWRVLRSDVRWLRDRAAAVRDLDVRLAQSPPPPVAAECRRRRTAARRELLAALDGPRLAALLEALSILPPLPLERARRAVARLSKRTLERGRRAVARPRDLAALHALRRSVRRLRFALEWSGRAPDVLVALQDTIGEACDRYVALRALPDVARRGTRMRAYRQRLTRELRAETQRAGALWTRIRPVLKGLLE